MWGAGGTLTTYNSGAGSHSWRRARPPISPSERPKLQETMWDRKWTDPGDGSGLWQADMVIVQTCLHQSLIVPVLEQSSPSDLETHQGI